MSYKEYRFPLNGSDPDNQRALREIIESNASSFDDYLLSSHSGDSQYSVNDGTFEVIEIGERFFSYKVDMQYFAGCKDMNFEDTLEGTIEYEILEGHIVIRLDETAWDVR
ncbi:hypothetical protein FS593_05345 [Lelliottia amnigena]|jgi:hypothetical protein|uniref:hypothetical protein n=1 Tax=Lelliottia amnigena TaxID=61646 RepID=UPI001F1CC604|nr:hypothetical protein [Lelliottia amnigena]UJD93756.1 hypothetical protein FS593_05345 [Lelliottia amnigena]